MVIIEGRGRLAMVKDFNGNNSNLYFTETEENIITSMRYKSKDLNKVRGANMAGGLTVICLSRALSITR